MSNSTQAIKTGLLSNAKALKGLQVKKLTKAFDMSKKTEDTQFQRNLQLARLVADAKGWLKTIEAKDLMKERDIKCNIADVCEANGMWVASTKNAYIYARVGVLDQKVVDNFIEACENDSKLSLGIKALDKFAKGKSAKKRARNLFHHSYQMACLLRRTKRVTSLPRVKLRTSLHKWTHWQRS